jgi:hypothetical protein
MSRGTTDRMTSVLRVRKIQEDIAAAARSKAERAVAEQEARFAQRQADVRRPWCDRVLVDLAFRAVDRAAVDLTAATEVADGKRTEHVVAVQRAKAIERLVERRRAEAATEEARKAALVLDDLATTQFARRHAR